MTRTVHGKSGFALLEVLIALALLAFVVLGLGNSVRASRRAEDMSRSIAEASALAVDKLEELHLASVLSTDLQPGIHQDSGNPLGPDGSPGGDYLRSWRVTASGPASGLVTVEMTVVWNDTSGPSRVQLVSYLAPSS